MVCADGRFKVTRVQPPTAKKIDAGEWAKSANIAAQGSLHLALHVMPGLAPGIHALAAR